MLNNIHRLKRDLAGCALLALVVSGCAMPAAGPTTGAIVKAEGQAVGVVPVQLLDVNATVADRVKAVSLGDTFSASLGVVNVKAEIAQPGDALEISIWEAPPAVLFGVVPDRASAQGVGAASRTVTLPDQRVNASGRVEVPFVGAVQVAGLGPDAIAAVIKRGLRGKANDPQVIVRIVNNVTNTVTVVGEVANNMRAPLSAKGERVLDVLAMAGGVRHPIGKMTVQITRDDQVRSMPLETVIRDPKQNVRLNADDVVTLLFQPFSFTALGAAGANHEVPFEGTGLTLIQALGRIGGLQDNRADPAGVFIFRFEEPKVFAGAKENVPTTPEGLVPVIYRVNMKDPNTLFAGQYFPIKNKDVIYISNAPLTDYLKFIQAVSQVVYPIAMIQSMNIFQ